MDLEEDLDFGEVGVERVPDLVNDDTYGGLRNPGHALGEEVLIHSVEDVPAIAEAILDEAMLGHLLPYALVPARDAGVDGEPVLLGLVDLVDAPPCVGRDGLGLAEVVSRVAEDLGELPVMAQRIAMVGILRVGLDQLLERRRLFPIEHEGV